MGFAGDWAGTINGLAVGEGSAYDLQGLTGWHDMSEAPLGGAGSMAPKQNENGSWYVPHYMPSRVVTMAWKINEPSGDFEAAIDSLRLATQPGVGEVPVTLQVGGTTSTAYGTVTNRVIPTTLDYLSGFTVAQIEVTCTDPRRFGAAVTGSTFLPSSTGGLTWPVTWPVEWPSTQVSGQVILTNSGDAVGPVTMRMNGPVTGPVITHVETGVQFAMAPSFAIASGDWLTVNCGARTVLLNDQSSRNGYVLTRGFPALIAGTNTFNFNAASYNSSAQLVVTASPSYI